MTGRPRFHLQFAVGDGADGGREVVLCIARVKDATSFDERYEEALRLISIGMGLSERDDVYMGRNERRGARTSRFAVESAKARRWRHDALVRRARRLRSITLHGSASARHQICTIG